MVVVASFLESVRGEAVDGSFQGERGGWLPPYTFGPKVLRRLPFRADLWQSAFAHFHFRRRVLGFGYFGASSMVAGWEG